jgi:MFS family permease
MTGRRWTILAAAAGAQGAAAAIFQGLPSVGPQLSAAYGLDLAELGLCLSAVTFGMTASLLAWGVLADRLGERRVIVTAAGEALELPTLALAALATSSWNGVASIAVAERAGARHSGTALGLYNTVVALTSAATVAGLAALAAARGWSAPFLVAAVTGAGAFLVLSGWPPTVVWAARNLCRREASVPGEWASTDSDSAKSLRGAARGPVNPRTG